MENSLVHTPIWVIILAWSAFTGLIIYIWNQLRQRITKLEAEGEAALKKNAESSPLTMTTHEEICGKVHAQFEKTLVEKLAQLKESFGLMIENAILKALHNYELEIGRNGSKRTNQRNKKL